MRGLRVSCLGPLTTMTSQATDLAMSLMDSHGLFEQGWTFGLDNAKTRCGYCNQTQKRITISRNLAMCGNHEDIRETVLHEIAHALVGCQHGHGEVWKAKAIEIGCSGDRLVKLEKPLATPKYLIRCACCAINALRHRRPTSLKPCAKCATVPTLYVV